MSIPYIRAVDLDAANDAYAKAEARRAQLLKRAAVTRTLAGKLHNQLLNCRIESAAAALFPQYTVRYSGTPERKVLHFIPDLSSAAGRMTICIGTKGQRRVTSSDLIEAAARDEKEAEQLADELTGFYDKLAQFNAIASYMQSLGRDITSIMIHTSRFY